MSGIGRPDDPPADGPAVVEAALFEHPGIADCAVVPDRGPDRVGAGRVAVIILRPGAKVTAEELARHVADRVGPDLVPGHFWLRQAPLPADLEGDRRRAEVRAQLDAGPAPGPTGPA